MHNLGRLLRICVLIGVFAVPAVAPAAPVVVDRGPGIGRPPKACPGHKHKAFGRLSYAFGSKRPTLTPRHTSLPCPAGPLPPGY